MKSNLIVEAIDQLLFFGLVERIRLAGLFGLLVENEQQEDLARVELSGAKIGVQLPAEVDKGMRSINPDCSHERANRGVASESALR